MRKLLARVRLAFYDGEPDGSQQTSGDPAEKMLTQSEVNKFLAEDRRRTEKKLQEQYKSQLQNQEKLYQDLLTSKTLTEQQRDQLESSLDTIQKELHTKEELLKQQLATTKDSLTAKLTDIEKKAKEWEDRYRESNIMRQLHDAAASGDAFNARQLATLLRPKTSMVEVNGEYQVVVEIDDVVDGKQVITKLPPNEAMKRMKELPDMYGFLFKSTHKSGMGANSATGGSTPGTTTTVDWKNMTQEQYRALRGKHPDLLGLGKSR